MMVAMRRPIALATNVAIVTAALVLAACTGGSELDSTPRSTDERPTAITPPTDTDVSTDSSGSSVSTPPAVPTEPVGTTPATAVPDAPPATVPLATFSVSPGVEQVTVTGAEPGITLQLVGTDGAVLRAAPADADGAALFRDVAADAVVRVRSDDAELGRAESGPVQVMSRDLTPPPEFYAAQQLPADGLGYITTRDGTTLSASVWLPGPVEDGPYPTVVEYSGYAPSDPASTGFPDVFTGLGYAYVGVNIRGTGCSGGSFRYFEYAQSLDGYDVVEAVAAQPWVRDHRVGMVGISYSGISQLFVAQTQPPSLAAITPLSVLADSYASTLDPGGILNTGFAVDWIRGVTDAARPGGQAWAAERIAAGDDICAANQGLRLQNPDAVAEIEATPFWNDDTTAEIAPRRFVDRITVPTFVAGAWQDEQTGSHFATMLGGFTGTDRFYATVVNGLHTEALSPAVFNRLVEFLDLYVARRVPDLAAADEVAPALAAGLFGVEGLELPIDGRYDGRTYDEALALFESDAPIEVLFEQGAADATPPRSPFPRFSAGFASWPIPGAEAGAWFLTGDGTAGGTLAEAPTDAVPTTGYLALPDAVPPTFTSSTDADLWSVDVRYDWQQGGPGTYASWSTAPLPADVAVIGSGSVDLHLMSNLGDTDIEVTISEVRPDGQELYVQSGWLRASQRALDPEASTVLRPVHTHREADAAPLPEGAFELVRIEVMPFAHVFRAGSQIRLSVDAPGGNRAVWVFDTIAGGEQVTIAHDGAHPSRLVLPVVAGVTAPAGLPACDALRGQPCRPVP
jgi:predicted acyl esterase